MIWTVLYHCASVVLSSQAVSSTEQKYQEYFAPDRQTLCLYKDGQHAAFRSFEKKDMANYWGFFKLPETDDKITSTDDITSQYCSGDAIYSLSNLLDSSLQLVFDNLKASKGESFRLGFFKMFPNRVSHHQYDAYLHFLNGGSRLSLGVSHTEMVLGSEQVFFRLVRDLCHHVSDNLSWSKHFVGLTVAMGKTDALSIEIWTNPDMNFIDLRSLRTYLMGIRSCPSAEDSFEGIRFTVANPETVDANDDKAKGVYDLFLTPTSPAVAVESAPLNTEWLALASKFPHGANGCFEGARLLSRGSSLLKTTADLARIHYERLATFPGVLAKGAFIILYKKSAFSEEAVKLLYSGVPVNINYYPGIHKAFALTLNDMPTFSAYVEAFRQCALFLTTCEYGIIEAAFFHFHANDTAKSSKLVIELWVPSGTPKNTQNHIQKSLNSFLMNNLEI